MASFCHEVRFDDAAGKGFDELRVFASELENQTSRIFVWDMKEKKLVTLPALNDSPNAQAVQ